MTIQERLRAVQREALENIGNSMTEKRNRDYGIKEVEMKKAQMVNFSGQDYLLVTKDDKENRIEFIAVNSCEAKSATIWFDFETWKKIKKFLG